MMKSSTKTIAIRMLKKRETMVARKVVPKKPMKRKRREKRSMFWL